MAGARRVVPAPLGPASPCPRLGGGRVRPSTHAARGAGGEWDRAFKCAANLLRQEAWRSLPRAAWGAMGAIRDRILGRGVRAGPCKSTMSSCTSEGHSLAPISVLLATTDSHSPGVEEDEGVPGLAPTLVCSHSRLSGAAGILSSLLAALGGKQTVSPAHQPDGKFCLLGLDRPAGVLPA